MQLKLELFHIKEVLRNNISLDMLIVMKLVEDGHILADICKGDAKLEIIHQGLIRKGLVTTDNKLTLAAKNVLKFIKEEAPKEKIIKKKPDESEFEKWWESFPGTDIFKHKGKTFKGTRTLKRDKENCRLKFNAILAEGEYTGEELRLAMEYDVLNKKESSVKTSENKLKYLQNSLTYLNQRSYEPYIELVKEGIAIEEKPTSKGVDI